MKGRSTQYRILNMMIITSYIKNQNYLKRKLLQKAIKTGFTAKNETELKTSWTYEKSL